MHDAVVLLAEGQCTITAEVAVGLCLADLALSSKGSHEQDEVFYLLRMDIAMSFIYFDDKDKHYS